MTQEELFKKLIAHSKEYGFVYQSSEIYDGLSCVRYGQGAGENNIRQYWWDAMTRLHENIVGLIAPFSCIPKPGWHRVTWSTTPSLITGIARALPR